MKIVNALKKAITYGLFAGFALLPSITQAFTLPTTLEKNKADAILQWIEDYKNTFLKDGVLHAFHKYTAPNKKTMAWCIQAAAPLFSKTLKNRSLVRLEYDYLWINDTFQEAILSDSHDSLNSYTSHHKPTEELFKLHKFGLSGRYIFNAEFIGGSYLFFDYAHKGWRPAMWLINPGIELMWPRYGTIVAEGTFNLSRNTHDRFYAGSIKLSKIKPLKLDIFSALSFIKYPDQPIEGAFTLLGCKFRIPVKKWDIRKRFTFGAQITYPLNEDSCSHIHRKHLNVSIYLQGSPFAVEPQNSLRDYLRMPVDRQAVTPHHPRQGDYHKRASTPPATPFIFEPETPSSKELQKNNIKSATQENSDDPNTSWVNHEGYQMQSSEIGKKDPMVYYAGRLMKKSNAQRWKDTTTEEPQKKALPSNFPRSCTPTDTSPRHPLIERTPKPISAKPSTDTLRLPST